MACSAVHHMACRNESGNGVLPQADASASLTSPCPRLHVPGFGMGEAARVSGSQAVHMCGDPRLEKVSEAVLLPEKQTL